MEKQNYLRLSDRTKDIVEYVSDMNGEDELTNHTHFVFHVETLKFGNDHEINITDLRAEIGNFKFFNLEACGGGMDKLVHFQYLLAGSEVKLETLFWALITCLNEAEERAKGKPLVCYSVSLLNSNFNPSDIMDFLVEHFYPSSKDMATIKYGYAENTKTIVIYNI